MLRLSTVEIAAQSHGLNDEDSRTFQRMAYLIGLKGFRVVSHRVRNPWLRLLISRYFVILKRFFLKMLRF